MKIILNDNPAISGQESTLKPLLQQKEMIKLGRNVEVKQFLVGGHKTAVPSTTSSLIFIASGPWTVGSPHLIFYVTPWYWLYCLFCKIYIYIYNIFNITKIKYLGFLLFFSYIKNYTYRNYMHNRHIDNRYIYTYTHTHTVEPQLL